MRLAFTIRSLGFATCGLECLTWLTLSIFWIHLGSSNGKPSSESWRRDFAWGWYSQCRIGKMYTDNLPFNLQYQLMLVNLSRLTLFVEDHIDVVRLLVVIWTLWLPILMVKGVVSSLVLPYWHKILNFISNNFDGPKFHGFFTLSLSGSQPVWLHVSLNCAFVI